MAGTRPAVYTIPLDLPFVDVLARGIVDAYGPEPLALSRVRVLVPHRRAARALRDAFLRAGDGAARILPRIAAIGDVDEEELTLAGGTAADELSLPPAIDPVRRRLLLMRPIKAQPDAMGGGEMQAPLLAAELARLIDTFQTEGIALADLKAAAPSELAAHWQETLDFLRITFEYWPAVLAEEGCLDPADRRNRLLKARAQAWRRQPPDYPVIAAGSTGSIPATADLLSVVARLPAGCVVLPGLDSDMAADSWDALTLTHPQYGLKRLLDRMRVDRREVDPWPAVDAWPRTQNGRARLALISETLRPPETTEKWRDFRPAPGATEGMTRLDLTDPAEEAAVIALILREALETPARTAALVTPDRALARRVMAALARWEVTVNDSAGTPLGDTPVGSFLNLIAELVLVDWTPARFLSLVKHPLAGLGLEAAECRRLARALEIRTLRGTRPAAGVAGMRALLEDRDAALKGFLDRIEAALQPLSAAAGAVTLPADWVAAHIAAAEAIAATAEESGARRLWVGPAGEAAALLLEELGAAGTDSPVSDQVYPGLLRSLMGEKVVRPPYGRHPRLFIWSPIEARLQRPDVMVLGGLNEGTWPADAPANPWLSRPMQAALGLPLPERQIGLSAHDFAQAAAAPRVYLTRAEKVDGVPTVPSRWLLRLDALAGDRLATEPQWRQWAEQLITAASRPAPPPTPRPPAAARPDRLSVTRVEEWIRNPYALYARHILGLKVLDPLDAEIDAAERGRLVHAVLDRFLSEYPDPAEWREANLNRLVREALGAAMTRPLVRALWGPRLERIASWVLAQLRADAAAGRRPLATEIRGELTLEIDGAPFTLTATADRIDTGPAGLIILDYKTGRTPSDKQVAAGFAPQLPLEGMMAEAGAFRGIGGAVAALEYWALKGGDAPGKVDTIKEARARITEAREGLIGMVRQFRDPATPYLSQPRPAHTGHGDYDHLARVKEWRERGET